MPASATWLLRQHGMDEYLESQARWAAHRGKEIGVEKAEAFRQYKGHPYPQDNLLLKLIGQDGRGRPTAGSKPVVIARLRAWRNR